MQETKKLLKPKLDVVFQSLFNRNNKEITKSFVGTLMEKEINEIIINDEKELIRDRVDDKLGILDLELEINGEEKVDVEIQLSRRENFIERLLFYMSKMYYSQIKRGKGYNAKRTLVIAIIDFDLELTKEYKEMETRWKFMETKFGKKALTEKMEVCIIEMKKAKLTYKENNNNKKAQWLMFLDDPNNKEVQRIMKNNKEIKEATFIVKKMSEDEKMQRIADLREKAIRDEYEIRQYALRTGHEEGWKQGIKEGIEEGRKEGRKEGREEGIEEGRKEGIEEGRKEGKKQGIEEGKLQGIEENKKEIIKKLYNKNMSIEEISEIVEIEENEIRRILKLL